MDREHPHPTYFEEYMIDRFLEVYARWSEARQGNFAIIALLVGCVMLILFGVWAYYVFHRFVDWVCVWRNGWPAEAKRANASGGPQGWPSPGSAPNWAPFPSSGSPTPQRPFPPGQKPGDCGSMCGPMTPITKEKVMQAMEAARRGESAYKAYANVDEMTEAMMKEEDERFLDAIKKPFAEPPPFVPTPEPSKGVAACPPTKA